MSFPGAETRSNKETVAAKDGKQKTACTQQNSQPPQFAGGTHPSKQFFGLTEQAPEVDLTHVIGAPDSAQNEPVRAVRPAHPDMHEARRWGSDELPRRLAPYVRERQRSQVPQG